MNYQGHIILTGQRTEPTATSYYHDIFTPRTCTCGKCSLPGRTTMDQKGILPDVLARLDLLTHNGRYQPVAFSCHQKDVKLRCHICGAWIQMGWVYADLQGEPFKAYVCLDCLAYGSLADPALPMIRRTR